MSRQQFIAIAALLAITFIPAAHGDETPPPKKWHDEAALAYVESSGNTNVKTLSAKNFLKYAFNDRVTGSWKVEVLRGETDGVLTAERYLTELRGDFAIDQRTYAYLVTGWLKDTFAGIDSNTSVGPGLGYKFMTGPKQFLLAEAGLSYVVEHFTNNTENDRLDGRLFGDYEYLLAEKPYKNKFKQAMEYLYDFHDSENYRFNSETSVAMGLNRIFSIKVSYTLHYVHHPVPINLKTTDTLLSVGLLANF